MKELTKDIKVYSFDELSSEAREKACQQVGNNMTSKAFWWDDTYDLFIKRCKEDGMKIDVEAICFTGFGAQGDGASFTCDDIDVEELLQSLDIKMSDRLKEKVLDYIYEVNIIRTSWRAFHEQTVHAEVFLDEDALEEEEEADLQLYSHDIADTLECKLERLKDDLCQQLYYDLEREYDYFHSAEYVDEVAYENSMLFLEDGTIYDWGE